MKSVSKQVNFVAMVFLLVASFLMSSGVQAANECVLTILKTNNVPLQIFIDKNKSKTFNLPIKSVAVHKNNVMILIQSGAMTAPYPVDSGQTLKMTDQGSRLKKITCLNAKTNRSGNIFTRTTKAITKTVKSVSKLKIRSLTGAEVNQVKSVFGNSVAVNRVKVTNTLGGGGRPWTTNTPPVYTINVGVVGFGRLHTNMKRLLIHEMTHVWQGQHRVPFMSNSAAHQTLAMIKNGGDAGGTYNYQAGKQWSKYNVEQQASIVEDWFVEGRSKSHRLYPYIRDNVRPGKPKAKTRF